MGNHNNKSFFEYSVNYREAAGPSESPIYRSPDEDNFRTAIPATSTVYSLFMNSVSRFSSRPFLGSRENPESDRLSRYVWETYAQVNEKVSRLADCLIELMEPDPQRLPTVGIYCKTRAEWLVVDLACSAQSLVSVILFDTLGFESTADVIRATKMTVMALSSVNKSVIYHLKREGEIPLLINLIQFEPFGPTERSEAQKLGFNLISYAELLAKGTGKGEKRVPEPETVYSICYTSGTYGPPSGVVIKHRQMTSMAASVNFKFEFNNDDLYFSYLPQAHIMERSMTYIAMAAGAKIGFYTGNMSHIRQDMQQLRPSIFAAVPRIIYKMADNIRLEVSALSPFKQRLFKRAMTKKRDHYRATGSLKHPIWDLVLKPIRASVGGKLMLAIVGGAPINSDELEFMRLALSAPIIEGYGLTESCACSLVADPSDKEMGHVGGPLPLVEAKMINLTTKLGETSGELCLRGPLVSTEIYVSPPNPGESQTLQLLDSDGWLHTGDVVTRLPHNGAFRIVDRLKCLFKLSHGEFIAPDKIECCYRCPIIDIVVIYGNPLESHLVAVVVPNIAKLKEKFLKQRKIRPDVPIEMLCSNPETREYILEKMSNRSARYHLNVYEQVKSIHLVPSLDANFFSNGKLKRNEVLKFFERELEALYHPKRSI